MGIIASFYDLETGYFTGKIFQGPNVESVELNTPDGCGYKKEHYDHKLSMVNLKTGRVIKRKPAWSEPVLDEAVGIIRSLEEKQTRALRELAIDPGNEDAKKILRDLDDKINVQRKRIREES